MKTFKETKDYIIEFATQNGACSNELNRVKNAVTKDEILAVIKDNLSWVSVHKLFNGVNILEYFSKDKLLEFSIGNLGADNTGFANSGDCNSGYRNSGNWNSGDRNSGDSNCGNWNSGNRNSGNRNSGDCNSGDWNSGYRNSGDCNSGYRNSGDWNSGYRNSGNRNSGDCNSGDCNSGYRNSGDCNSGYRNSGAFCTDNNPTIKLFDKDSKMTIREWEKSRTYKLMNNLNPNIWISEIEMTDEEKVANRNYKINGGYLKTIPYKEMWLNFWENLCDSDKQLFIDLPNFDSKKFEEITGIKI